MWLAICSAFERLVKPMGSWSRRLAWVTGLLMVFCFMLFWSCQPGLVDGDSTIRYSLPISMGETAAFGFMVVNRSSSPAVLRGTEVALPYGLTLVSSGVTDGLGTLRGRAGGTDEHGGGHFSHPLEGYVVRPGETANICLEFAPLETGTFEVTEWSVLYRHRGRSKRFTPNVLEEYEVVVNP